MFLGILIRLPLPDIMKSFGVANLLFVIPPHKRISAQVGLRGKFLNKNSEK